MLKEWEELPEFMKRDEVREYYDVLAKHRKSLWIKRIFDFVTAMILLGICAVPMAVICVLIIADSRGGPFYRQERITSYGKKFKIHKFRTMTVQKNRRGLELTVNGDGRITRIGGFLRKYRLDELPQLLDILAGDMSFVGTRAETVRYVKKYTPEMYATLLLPAGVTSEASIRYKDEAKMLDAADDIERVYVEKILPEKMKYNLKSIREYSFLGELLTMLRTVLAVLGKEYGK